jgi:TonB family protein
LIREAQGKKDKDQDGRFVITPEGNIKKAEVVKKPGNIRLDQTALMAVKLSGLFSKPPKQFFKGGINLVVTVVFKLI